MEPLLKAEKIWKRFGSLTAIADLSISLSRGEIVGVTGPNGSGKSTLINILSGMVMPDSGNIIFKGKKVTHLSLEERARMGIVRTFQIPKTVPQFRVIDCVRLSLLGSGKGGKVLEESLEEILHKCGLWNQRFHQGNKLSQGCLRKLEIARAMGSSPIVILLDELFSALSLSDMREMEELMLDLNARDGISFILVSHNLHIIEALCRRSILIDDGKVLFRGDPGSVRKVVEEM